MSKCEDDHIPTCMFDNNHANLLSHVMALLLHMKVLNQHEMLEKVAKASMMLMSVLMTKS